MSDYHDYIDELLAANARQSSHRYMHTDSKFDDMQLRDLPIAMAYVPIQKLGRTFDADQALTCGTLFEDLHKPFLGKKVKA